MKTFDDRNQIEEIHLFSPKQIIVTSNIQTTFLNATTLKTERVIDTFARYDGLIIIPDMLITLNDNGEEDEGIISFWDLSDTEEPIRTIENDPTQRLFPRFIKLMKQKLIQGFASGRIQIFDIQTARLIKTIDLHDDPEAYDNDSLYQIVVQQDKFVALFEGFICLFNYNGDLINEIGAKNTGTIFSLPDNRIVSFGPESGIVITNLETLEIEPFQEGLILSMMTVSSSGKIIFIDTNGNLVVFE